MIDRIFPSCPSFWLSATLMYWIILSRMRFRFLSVRRVQFHSLQINNDKRASVRLHPASPASWNKGAPEGGREGKGVEAMSDVLLPGKQARIGRPHLGCLLLHVYRQ